MSDPACRLYLITPPRLDDWAAFAETLKRTLAAGDVACLQLRMKDESDDAIRRAVAAIRPVCHGADVALLLNDRPDLAKDTGCDGVHVGQTDASYAQARAIVGADAIVGVTCHDSRHLAMIAGEAGADYVAFGAFFPTTTKEPPTQADPEILRWWSEMMIVPSVAIGGITVENCTPLVETGTDFLAVCNGVWGYPEGPEAAVRAFVRVIAEICAQPD
ncbi:thiamine phosphate synthase [Rhodospirillum rubrum]|uniref:thiamine phosphate synthase n=1 Tax=Rhodospirillum rubrum TaxID=1085 RepID=UPI001908AFC5|nr:thiamine phosphate synthase [Rhodospirillum rubrum]MBK1665899.1 thiamine phosphate synthase [Rhodospirillum rubrum]MBK1678400.1 thiamine phosphate synthase [Rhodospirillum rubrum]